MCTKPANNLLHIRNRLEKRLHSRAMFGMPLLSFAEDAVDRVWRARRRRRQGSEGAAQKLCGSNALQDSVAARVEEWLRRSIAGDLVCVVEVEVIVTSVADHRERIGERLSHSPG